MSNEDPWRSLRFGFDQRVYAPGSIVKGKLIVCPRHEKTKRVSMKVVGEACRVRGKLNSRAADYDASRDDTINEYYDQNTGSERYLNMELKNIVGKVLR